MFAEECTSFSKKPPRYLRPSTVYVEVPKGYEPLDPVQVNGLEWLRRSKDQSGSWGQDIGVTALGIIAHLECGIHFRSHSINGKGEYQFLIREALTWLRRAQLKNGIREGSFQGAHNLQDHALATVALLHSCRASDSVVLPDYRDRALRFLRGRLELLGPDAGGIDVWPQLALKQQQHWKLVAASAVKDWAECTSPLDMENYYLRTLQLKREGGAAWDSWRVQTQKVIASLQVVQIGDDHGSWDPVGEWNGKESRAHATAMNLLVYSTCLH